MGWSIGFDSQWNRDIGYGVPAYCDHPKCKRVIDRGLSYVCGGEPYGGENGCGLYFCAEHLGYSVKHDAQMCGKCRQGREPFTPKPDCPQWVTFKLSDGSWKKWRAANPAEVKELRKIVEAAK